MPSKGHKPDSQLRREDFSRRLNEALDARGYPPKNRGRQTALADAMDVSQGAARKWLEGESFPDLDKIVDLALKLKINSDWLLTGRGDMDIERKRESHPIDERLLSEVMDYASRRTEGMKLTPARQARLVMLLYEVALKDGTVDTPLSESIIKLVISQ